MKLWQCYLPSCLFLGAMATPVGIATAQDAGVDTDSMTTDNVVIVLDASGSMRTKMGEETRMDAAKNAIKAVVRNIPPSTHVGLLVFSAVNLKNEWVYPLGPVDKARFIRGVDLPRPRAKTPLGHYMGKGANALLEKREAQGGYGTYRLLVVTDGKATDQKLMDKMAREAVKRGIVLDVIGVAMRDDHSLATMAQAYRRANDAKALQQAVSKVFAEVSDQPDDEESREAFELISWISNDQADQILKALGNTDNSPLDYARR